jgi:hypothetical protein
LEKEINPDGDFDSQLFRFELVFVSWALGNTSAFSQAGG